MGVAILRFILLALSFNGVAGCKPLFVLIAPNVFWVGNNENVVVESHCFEISTTVTIEVQDFFTRKVFYKDSVKLNPASGPLFTSVKIPAGKIETDSRSNSYVYLRVTSEHFTLEKPVIVAFDSGYVFVQTDKPLYNPTETVKYRIFALTHDMKPVTGTVLIQIKNPEDILFKEDFIYLNGGTFSMTYPLPDITNMGIWKIVTRVQGELNKTYTTEFEVKEYVLPNFEVTIAAKPFYHIDDEKLEVTVTARYLYGKFVQGNAFVVFGLKHNDKKYILQDTSTKIEINEQDGSAIAELSKGSITKKFPGINLIGGSIFVTAVVITSTGSDMEVAEKTDIRIVTSPYSINFIKTSKYFIPGMPFSAMVKVTNPDGSPAYGIQVEFDKGKTESKTTKTDKYGVAKASINTNSIDKQRHLTVTTQFNSKENEQAKADMVISAYKPEGSSSNFLYIDVQPDETEILIGFQVMTENKNDIPYISYLVLSKGKIVKSGTVKQSSSSVIVSHVIPVSSEMKPSFRIVAYYLTQYSTEIVANSVWVHLSDACLGELTVTKLTRGDIKPGGTLSIKVKGDPGATVGLVAVDKAVFLLNNKNKMSQSKVWDLIEDSDTGCTPGGGANNMGVFTDAGLLFQSAGAATIGTAPRQEVRCPKAAKRRRRFVSVSEGKTSLRGKYSDEQQRKCCQDGMNDIPMDYSCEKRAQYITAGKECVEAFLHCCVEIHKIAKDSRIEQLVLARSEAFDEDEEDDDVEIQTRSKFPESWLWFSIVLPTSPLDKAGYVSKEHKIENIPDSITSWEILAVGLSKDKGICVAEPLEVQASMKFFIDLKLPYSIVRNEQVKIKAILYNYLEEQIKVRLDLFENENICSAASNKKKDTQEVEIEAHSSKAVLFTIIPLKLGKHSIDVRARVIGEYFGDRVKKDILVVPEGQQIEKNIMTVNLNPTKYGGKQQVDVGDTMQDSIVPGTESWTYIKITGEPLAGTIENTFSDAKIGELIKLPSGCVEQNMAKITAPVIATHYLDKTKQWESVGVQRRAEAIDYIRTGYTKQLIYKKDDYSYPPYSKRDSSTWLTAYVVKVFAMASSLLYIDVKVLCGAVTFLISKQQPEGSFKEDAGVTDSSIMGGAFGSEAETTLAAFVLIAMAEANPVCRTVPKLSHTMDKTTSYLQGRLSTLQRPYSKAISIYALALMNKKDYYEDLMSASENSQYWPDTGSRSYTIEATGYALLALLKMGKREKAGPVMEWLMEHKSYWGGYSATQDTMVGFQALSEYQGTVTVPENKNLTVEIDVAQRSTSMLWTFSNSDSFKSKTERIKLDQSFTVLAKGNREGTMMVMTRYQKTIPKIDCKNFELNVMFEKAGKRRDSSEDVYELDICIQYLGASASGTAILDISMLTGFEPDFKDLDNLMNRVDRYIEKYEMDILLSIRGSLIIYLYSIPRDKPACIKFKINQLFEVGPLQPASVTVYRYYAKENRCTALYNAGSEKAPLKKICQNNECKCAEGSCSALKTENKNVAGLMKLACDNNDFAYKVTLLHIEESAVNDHYKMNISVIKQGTDEIVHGDIRYFLSPSSCREVLKLQKGKEYLIMGPLGDLWQTKNEFDYIFGSKTWMQVWPTEEECKTDEFKITCQTLEKFTSEMETSGCPN
ncbi:complement C3-like [Huso huso]|uniref:Complement C3-like n=1 Tax=Huso huso TaxID=61971 RepID=A0ABR0Y683_HUSHU